MVWEHEPPQYKALRINQKMKEFPSSIKYEVIIFWSDVDDAFIAEIPELAGCMADGATYEEAIVNAQIVINQWIETAQSLGRVIPKALRRLQAA